MKHPYFGLPDYQFWKNEPGIANGGAFDPLAETPFVISVSDKIVTAGSCFARHIGAFMSASGYNYFITERAHPVVPEPVARSHHYGLFSARYGNVYTTRQLRQLLMRAFGEFVPVETAWTAPNGSGVVDPFRPQIQPRGFLSEAELRFDRQQHLSCVREAIEKMDVFVFTLGLTEAWVDARDGAVFPLAPGVAGGIYNPAMVRFVNFDEAESYEDLRRSIKFIRSINPGVRIILTVSPVALNATYEHRHVFVSTTWSKSVLRIVAEKAAREFSECVYFPSYEIITSPFSRGRYFAADCREVSREGVDHVMRVFLKHFADDPSGDRNAPEKDPGDEKTHLQDMNDIVEALCDEAAIRAD